MRGECLSHGNCRRAFPSAPQPATRISKIRNCPLLLVQEVFISVSHYALRFTGTSRSVSLCRLNVRLSLCFGGLCYSCDDYLTSDAWDIDSITDEYWIITSLLNSILIIVVYWNGFLGRASIWKDHLFWGSIYIVDEAGALVPSEMDDVSFSSTSISPSWHTLRLQATMPGSWHPPH